jgi:hypothetical protein
MRFLLLVFAICASLVGTGKSAEAQNYPWCAHLGTGFDSMNCGFTTFQQCMDTVSGIGGFCQPNAEYQLPSGPRSLKKPQGRYPY